MFLNNIKRLCKAYCEFLFSFGSNSTESFCNTYDDTIRAMNPALSSLGGIALSRLVSSIGALSWLVITVAASLEQGLLLVVLVDPVVDVLLSESLFVLLENADEVCEESIKKGSNEEAEHDLLLPGDGKEANTVVASGDLLGLVEEPEVNGVPGGRKGQRNDGKHESDLKEDSLAVGFVGKEGDGASQSHDEWDGQEHADEDVPPVDLVIEELVEDLHELADRDEDDEQCDSLNTTVNWEDQAALHVLSLNGLALANAAAAHRSSLVDSEGSLSLLNWSHSIFFRLG